MRVKLALFQIITLFLLIFPVFSYGQTATSSPSNLEIEKFKEKIATKVAELEKQNNQAISGYITEISENIVKIKTKEDKEYKVKLDETLTKYYQIKGDRQIEIKVDDLKKDDYIIVSGVINEQNIDANFIFVDQSFLVLSGRVTEIDKENYSLKILTIDHEEYLVDIEVATKQQILNIKSLELERGGFSKIKEGDTIHFVIKKTSKKEESRYSAYKTLIIPQEFFLK